MVVLGDVIRENWDPGYSGFTGQSQDFFSVFAVFFPAAIGIFAGANISENLKVQITWAIVIKLKCVHN